MVIVIFEKNMQIPFLTDIYGDLLSERKRELLDFYYNEDYSLSEIAEITGISRQGIRDSVKKSEAELLEFEKKLCLLKRTRDLENSKAEIKARDRVDITLEEIGIPNEMYEHIRPETITLAYSDDYARFRRRVRIEFDIDER